jgi:hypothetical protein
MRGRGSWLLVVAVAGVVVVAAQASGKTRGQTGSGVPCGTAGLGAQLAVAGGTSYTLGGGKWKAVSWSTKAGANGGQMALVVYRPQNGSPNTYRVVVASDVETLNPDRMNTFKLKGGNHRWDVKHGDVIGFWCSADADAAFTTGSGGDSFSFQSYASVPSAGPSVGDLVTLSPSSTGRRADVSVTLKSR